MTTKPGSFFWRVRRRIRFESTPRTRRISLKLRTDGRHLTFILVSLHRLGFGIRIIDSPCLFREIISLNKAAPIPFVASPSLIDQNELLITDDSTDVADKHKGHRILIDYNYFHESTEGIPRMPYFIHPFALHRGLPRQQPYNNLRPISLGFFGSHDADFYDRNFHFPILSRTKIINSLLHNFANSLSHVNGPPSEWGKPKIAVSIDNKGGDRNNKEFLTPINYFDGLRSCNFILCPPGWCMPLSHSLIEAMQCGAIPILNHPSSVNPSLCDGVDCLTFNDEDSLIKRINDAISMSDEKVASMRSNVLAYFAQHLEPGKWWKWCLDHRPPRVLVNNEEVSIGLRNAR